MNSKTLLYILKRILLAILTVWVVITITFFVMRAIPGGPFMGEKAITAAAQAALEAKYGLDKPLMEQQVENGTRAETYDVLINAVIASPHAEVPALPP